MFSDKISGPAQLQREGRELRRLVRLIDTVFAIVIAAISLLQVLLVLAYLMAVTLGMSVGNDPVALAAQSVTAIGS